MKIFLKYLLFCLPHHALTYLIGSFMKFGFSKYAIKAYARIYGIDTSNLEKSIHEFRNLNEFFTRKLERHTRPVDRHIDSFVSPADGMVTQMGQIENGTLIQAKGDSYTVEGLLNDQEKAIAFQNGSFMTIYLSPKDYHRIHAPIDGSITEYSYIPGRLYPVNKLGVNSIKGIFTKNERVATYLNTGSGQVAIVKIGALIVGSVQLAYQQEVEQIHKRKPMKKVLKSMLPIDKADEIGHFEFGSTVILLFEENQITLESSLKPGSAIKMGQTLGYRVKRLERKIN
ncbi:archaetidylserine decarboxylase [Pseudalkalibacillus salsuginis]|uniref:archaetidylserine decarboxylase n=1 Tax=Pseudalkalibacillus salsuginis TaxID=2910972 RepID=UPI001EEBD77A|nr:archaetidylserine decarboxylase [Pseudalkalibacillus salsuginis]MCF6411003.1 archaetidylserine decarboxylase [Pseudalkalibacillus salsuginis]